jgi:transcriptional regulator with XRE-family HTH domain
MQALKQYMQNAGMNQTELAKFLGVNQGQLNHWLTRRRQPSVSNLKLIATKTGIKLERLAEDL